jgi:tetratricopeptide (TPR) repeat protein
VNDREPGDGLGRPPGGRLRLWGAAALLGATCLASVALLQAGLSDRDAERARDLIDRGDIPAAIALYSRASGRFGGRAEGERGVGEAFFILARRGNPSRALLDRARKHLAEAVALSPAEVRAQMSLRHIDLLSSRTPDEAAAAFDAAVALVRRYPGEPTLALRFLALVEDAAVTPRLRHVLGSGPRRKAVAAASAFLAERNWIPVERFDSLVDSGLFPPSECIELFGTEKAGLWRLAGRVIDGGGWEKWLDDLEGPDESAGAVFFRLSVARKLLERRDEVRATAILRRVVETHPDEDSRLLLARAIIASGGAWQEAGEQYRLVVELDPMNLDHRKEYASLLVAHGMYLTAARVISPVDALADGDDQVLYLKGRIREAEGRLDEALVLYRRAGKIAPGREEYRKATERVGGGP